MIYFCSTAPHFNFDISVNPFSDFDVCSSVNSKSVSVLICASVLAIKSKLMFCSSYSKTKIYE